MLKLQDVNHGELILDKNTFCGPSVISSLTGKTTGECARILCDITGKSRITGVHTWAVLMALRREGITNIRLDLPSSGEHRNLTIASWLLQTHGTRQGRVFLMIAGRHFQLISGSNFVCGITNRIVHTRHSKVGRRRHVESVYELFLEDK